MKVLIIEDAKDDFKDLATKMSELSIIPNCPNLDNGYDIERAVEIFNSNDRNKLKKYLTSTIQYHFQELRVIICDLKLIEGNTPNYRGDDIIKWIREDIKVESYPLFTKYIPIIIYTRFSDEECTKTALTAGGSCYVQKNENYYIKEVAISQGKQFSKLCDDFILKKKYKIGLTFTGTNFDKNIPHRDFIEEIANKLAHEYSVQEVFYDKFHEEKVKNLKASRKLSKVYREECEYIAVFLSADYATANEWTGIEWSAIQEYITEKVENIDKIIPIKIENFDITTTPNLDKDVIWQSAINELNAFNGLKLNKVEYTNMKEMIENNTKNIVEIIVKKINSKS